MQNYHRVVFISTINDVTPLAKRDILNQFNEDATSYFQRGEVTGILFYGNNYLFHCIEASMSHMDQIKKEVHDYPYHHSQTLIYDKTRITQWFGTWRMKFTQNEPLMQAFFAKHDWSGFNPYLLEGELLDEFMAIVQTYSDAVPLPIPLSSGAETATPAPVAQHIPWLRYPVFITALLLLAGAIFVLISFVGITSISSLLH